MLSDKTSALADDLSSGAVPKSVRPKATSTDRKTDVKRSLKRIKSEKNIHTALGHVLEASTAPMKKSQSENFLLNNQ
jgi:hypothetical protein